MVIIQTDIIIIIIKIYQLKYKELLPCISLLLVFIFIFLFDLYLSKIQHLQTFLLIKLFIYNWWNICKLNWGNVCFFVHFHTSLASCFWMPEYFSLTSFTSLHNSFTLSTTSTAQSVYQYFHRIQALLPEYIFGPVSPLLYSLHLCWTPQWYQTSLIYTYLHCKTINLPLSSMHARLLSTSFPFTKFSSLPTMQPSPNPLNTVFLFYKSQNKYLIFVIIRH